MSKTLTTLDLDIQLDVLRDRIEYAISAYRPINSLHEGYGIIQEELDEYWDEVRKRPGARDLELVRKELLDIAAAAMRTLVDIDTKLSNFKLVS